MRYLAVTLFSLFLASPLCAVSEKELPEKYRIWLTEEVPYIITPVEKQAFLSLSSDRDRDFFIEAFWAQRDPTPGTPTNEFRDEHYQRITYANAHFIDSPMKGWKTDRGRVYVILGPPKTVERFEDLMSCVPVEVWFYLGKTEYGFPAGFNVMFFQRHGTGEYRLYHPGSDGPASLFRQYRGDPTNVEKAYEDLKVIDPVLAEYSLSLLIGSREDRMGAAISSEFLLKNIAGYPAKLIDPRYAEKITKYRTQIETDYSLSYVDAHYMTRLTRRSDGRYFLNYAIQPKSLSVDQYEKTFYASFKLYGKLEDSAGHVIHEFTKTVPIELDEATLQRLKGSTLCMTDMVPVIPGSYKFTLLVKNTVSKEFSDLEERIVVPDEGKDPVLLTPLVYENASTEDATAAAARPFRLGSLAPDLRPQSAFVRGTALSAAFQVAGPTEGLVASIELLKETASLSKTEKPLAEIASGSAFRVSLPTAELAAGEYTAKISVHTPGGVTLSEKTVAFSISPVAAVPQPYVYSKVLPPEKGYLYDLIIADEYARSGNESAALRVYEQGAAAYPVVAEFKVGLARLMLQKREYGRVIDLLSAITGSGDSPIAEGYLYLATAQQASGQYAPAVENYTRYTNKHGTDYRVLNSIGECYFATGQKADAIKVWQSSLQIYPDQPALKNRLAQLGSTTK